MKLSVLQWNVWFKEKADNVVRFVRETDADIVCLQELTRDSADNPGRDIVAEIEALGYHSAYEATLIRYGTGTITMGDGIFSKFPLTDKRHVYVQREDPSSHHYSKENRLYVEATLSVGNSTLTVGTVHLSYVSEFFVDAEKKKEVDKLLAAVRGNTERFILSGDLNSNPDTYTIERLEKILKPAGPDYAQATWTTKPFSYDGFEASTLDWRLDYVFTTPDVKVLESKIIQTDVSDHLPILATIEI